MYPVQELSRISQAKIGCVFIIRDIDICVPGHAVKAAVGTEARAVFRAHEINGLIFCL